jgi:hypothetical protein
MHPSFPSGLRFGLHSALLCILGGTVLATMTRDIAAQATPPQQGINIAGISVGMDSAEVHRLLRAEKAEFLVHARRVGQRGVGPGPWLGSIDAGQQTGPGLIWDGITVEFTLPPSGRQAVMINRHTRFRAGAEPSLRSIKDAQIARFGTHGVEMPEGMLWHFDSSGRPVTRTTPCVDQVVGLYVYRNRTSLTADVDRQATKLGEHEAFARACGYYVVANWIPARTDSDLVGILHVIIEHAPKRIAALKETAAMRAKEPQPSRGALLDALSRKRGGPDQ